MEKIRKWMTLGAIVGTILVTAVFCYMPIREMLREYHKKTVSLENQQTVGTIEDTAEVLKENMEEMQNEEAAQEGSSGQEHEDGTAAFDETIVPIVFEIDSAGQQIQTTLWKSADGIGYVFLPGFAKDKPLQVKQVTDGGYVTLGNVDFYEGDVIEHPVYEEAYACVVFDKQGTATERMPLIFMHSSPLPMLSLETASGSMETIHASKEAWESGEVALFSGEGILLYEGEAKEVSGRGNSTFGLLKKPYEFQLKESADLFGFGKAKSWNLLADGYDETKLRNAIMFDFARALDMEYTPEGQSVDLYCNGRYYGVYYLCEKVQIGEGRIEIDDMQEHVRAVYGQTELENLETVEAENGSYKWTTTEVEAEDISGGYLLEREILDRYAEKESGFLTKQKDAYVLAAPRYATQAQVEYIADYVQQFQDALWQKDGLHKETGTHYSSYIDMDSFVKKYLLEEVSKNYDGGVTSSFFYKKSDAQGGKLYAGPAWDYDVAFGNCNLDKMIANPEGLTLLEDHIYGTGVFAKLYEKEEFKERVIAVYRESAAPYLEALLETEIDALALQMKQAVRMDDIRWEALSNRYRYYEDYENDIRFLKYFIKERKDFFDEVWIEGEIYHSVTFMVDGLPYKKFYVRDGEVLGEAPVPARYSSLFLGWYSESYDVPYDAFKPVYEDMVFYSSWQELSAEEIVTVP